MEFDLFDKQKSVDHTGDTPSRGDQPPDQSAWAVEIALAVPLDTSFSYAVPQHMQLERGDWVEVPFGSKTKLGLVWSDTPKAIAELGFKVKTITNKVACPPVPTALMDLLAWVAAYYMAPLGQVVRSVMHEPGIRTPLPLQPLYQTAQLDPSTSLTPTRRTLTDWLTSHRKQSRATILAATGVSAAVFKGCLDKGLIVETDQQELLPADRPDPDAVKIKFRDDQTEALEQLRTLVEPGSFQPILLDGVTGSGKTLVYFDLIAEAVRQSKSVLVLLPEIALSAQWLKQFQARFGVVPAVWHSALSPAERRQTWRAVLEDKVSVVVGARSALYLPFPSLGLIVVDEEHEGAFKQEETTRYHGRDVAVMRAKFEDCPVILSSATPALETYNNSIKGRYARVVMTQRHSSARATDIRAIDMRRHKPDKGKWLSPKMVEALTTTMEAGDQALLFLNRRGYAPLTLCSSCGFQLTCDYCSAWMVRHRFRDMLACHHCGTTKPVPQHCPECEEEDTLIACGPGVERVLEEAQALFPEKTVDLVSSDHLVNPAQVEDFIARMKSGEIDILVGTQIVAKGYNFPDLTMVGIVDADLGLKGGDPRASERAFQLIHQVKGRAGRFEKPGSVVLQTYDPNHPVLESLIANDRDQFFEAEIEQRAQSGLPPFGRLAIVHLTDPDEFTLKQTCLALADRMPQVEGLQILGPAPSPIPQVRGRWRYRFILKAGLSVKPQPVIRAWLADFKLPSNTRLSVDIDPVSFV